MGSGHYKADRGGRQHRGIDFICEEGDEVLSPVRGTVTKIGMPYANEHYRYVEITNWRKRKVRIFYVMPTVARGQEIEKDQPIGLAQCINDRVSSNGQTYGERGMQSHIHVECIQPTGDYINPELVLV